MVYERYRRHHVVLPRIATEKPRLDIICLGSGGESRRKRISDSQSHSPRPPLVSIGYLWQWRQIRRPHRDVAKPDQAVEEIRSLMMMATKINARPYHETEQRGLGAVQTGIARTLAVVVLGKIGAHL